MELFIIIVIVTIIIMRSNSKRKAKELEERKRKLMLKYNDFEIVDLIIKRAVWQEQTEEQLIDSIGKPSAIDQHVLKTKTKETWKYYPLNARSYAQRIILENGIVVGWKKTGN